MFTSKLDSKLYMKLKRKLGERTQKPLVLLTEGIDQALHTSQVSLKEKKVLTLANCPTRFTIC